MNERYFACPKCQVYIDAGYRWAYWQLEKPQHVILNEGVDIDNLLKLESYWNPSIEEPLTEEKEKDDWLCKQVLPTVKDFLLSHKEHGVIYMLWDTIFAEESLWYNWREIVIGKEG